MPVSVKIINTESQPNAGNAIVGVAGANGLGASGTLIKEMSSNNRLAPTGPYSASNLDISISNSECSFLNSLIFALILFCSWDISMEVQI